MRRQRFTARWYCTECGALYSSLGSGAIVCQRCGALGLRGCSKVPRRVGCPIDGCEWRGWDDGGVNDDLGNHLRREHKEVTP